MRSKIPGILLALSPASGLAQTAGTVAPIILAGPSTVPGAPQITPAAIAAAVNAAIISVNSALALKEDLGGSQTFAGGTVPGASTFSASGTGLTVTNDMTVGGTFSSGALNVTSARGIQFGGITTLFATTGNLYQQGVYVGPGAGAAMVAGNIPQNFGMVAIGVKAFENSTNATSEGACGGAYCGQYATTANGQTGWGEHTIGFDNANLITAMGNDSQRDTIGCAICTSVGAQSQRDGTGSGNTTLGGLALQGNSGSIGFAGTPHLGDRYTIAFSTTNTTVVNLPTSVSYTAGASDTLAIIATALVNAINSITPIVTANRTDGHTVFTDSGVAISAFLAPLAGGPVTLGLHFPGGNTSGWSITPTATCVGTCSVTLTINAPFSGVRDVAIGEFSLYGVGLTAANDVMTIGAYSLANLAGTSFDMVCAGSYCGYEATSGNNTALVGQLTARVATVLTNDAGIGDSMLAALTTGTGESVLGGLGCYSVTTGSNNLCLGYGVTVPSPTGNWQGSIMGSIIIVGANIGGGGSNYGLVGFGGILAPGAAVDIAGPDASTGLAFRLQNSASALLLSVSDLDVLTVGAPAMSANGSVATAMSSLGPAGAHTTVQEWLTITDSVGTVRYIPAF